MHGYTMYVLHMFIGCVLGDPNIGYAYLWVNLSLGIIFFLPAPTLCQFQRPSWRKNIRIVVYTYPGRSGGGGEYLG